MKKEIRNLISNRQKFYSQSGEDGFLAFMLGRLPERSGWCVEFGAWDGQHLSNTYHLIKNLNYKAVLIEGDSQKHVHLNKNMQSFSDVHCLNRFVEIKGPNSLDSILASSPIPKDFDVLSIDIDGNDYWVWKNLVQYKPKIVIIEINNQNLPDDEAIHNPDSKFEWGVSGSSIKSMTDLAHQKGYSLIANIGCNAVYVRSEYLQYFYSKEPTPREVYLYGGQALSSLNLKQLQHIGAQEILGRLKHSIRNRFLS